MNPQMSSVYSFSSGGSINGDSLIDSDNAVTDGDGLVNGGDTATGSDGPVIGDDAEISCASLINGDGSFNSDDDGDMDSDNVINISSDDEAAVVLSQLETRTQTFLFTITRKIQSLNGQVVNVITTAETDYFEN